MNISDGNLLKINQVPILTVAFPVFLIFFRFFLVCKCLFISTFSRTHTLLKFFFAFGRIGL